MNENRRDILSLLDAIRRRNRNQNLLDYAIFGLFLPNSRVMAARQIDKACELKDRMVTALDLLGRSDLTPMEQIQIADAASFARGVMPKNVVPYRTLRFYSAATFVLVLLVLFSVTPRLPSPHSDETTTVVRRQLEENIMASLEQLARKNPNEKPLSDLYVKAKQHVNETENMDQSLTKTLETFSTLSQTITEAMPSYDTESTAVSLAEIGAAFSSVNATRAAGSTIKSGDLTEAASEIRDIKRDALSQTDREILGGLLENAAIEIMRRHQSRLAEITQNLAEEIASDKPDASQNAANDLAEFVQTEGLRREIRQSLEKSLANLQQAKTDYVAANALPEIGGSGSAKTASSSQNQGSGTAGDPTTGNETRYDANRKTETITGIHGEGPTEIETVSSLYGEAETVKRPYIEVYREYEAAAENVMNTEKIPLDKRQLLRTYFQSIRPAQ